MKILKIKEQANLHFTQGLQNPESCDIIPENHSEWSNKLLSVALLDCLLGILDCSTSFFQTNNLNTQKWEQILETMRQEVKSRWTIEEKLVLNQIEK